MRRRASIVAPGGVAEPLKRGRADWVPQRALRYAWERIDPVHGRGGLM